MSSFPKHSFEQAYDHTFPPSPLQQHTDLPMASERTPLIAPVTTNDSNVYDSTAGSSSATETDALLETGLADQQQQQTGGRRLSSRSDTSPLSTRELTTKELKILLRYSGPVVLTYALQNSMQLASLVSLGHMGSLELAACSLASMFAAVTGWSVSLGAATALDTLCSQSYTSHHPHTIGLHLQRSILILMIFLIPIVAGWVVSEPIFTLLGQEQDLAKHAAMFLWGLVPGAPAYLIFECVKKYLQAQGIMHASTYVLLISSPINAFLNFLLVWNKDIGFGFMGAPIAISISYWIMLILLLLYIRFVNGRQGWGGWSWDAFTGWPGFLKLAVPGIMMVCTEWWAFELTSLAASFFGTIALAAQSVVLQTSILLYAVPFGVSIAASNRVGNLIGKGDHHSAKIASRVSIVLSISLGMINSLILIILKKRWGRLFSEDTEVVTTVAKILPLVAFFQISDGIAGVGGGVLRGVGLQHLGAILNAIAYYFLAFPVGYVLAFKLGWGLAGLWSALSLALWLVSIGELWIILRTNWSAEVQKNKIRNDLLAKHKASIQAEIQREFPEN
ncbi:hypothetical protein BGZ65_009341 [Modicella reniformis]|uniref:MATE efflux family protein n=1 Tax=Modicella reniformis TaxID=1440133 RepID=A0A9P6J4R4_9FUNG|nr:hypothetical protein BGZ65_009341 [Modicella reniformis]